MPSHRVARASRDQPGSAPVGERSVTISRTKTATTTDIKNKDKTVTKKKTREKTVVQVRSGVRDGDMPSATARSTSSTTSRRAMNGKAYTPHCAPSVLSNHESGSDDSRGQGELRQDQARYGRVEDDYGSYEAYRYSSSTTTQRESDPWSTLNRRADDDDERRLARNRNRAELFRLIDDEF
ncbi:hypothetical protein BP5796_08120 [Coleophoma crateriformis]|uniref:Uncharacterized protein n=1 Tax=Coleophoma crateriformis TaxID=565419 RepID=A0A3D8RDR5_9HELO|nr:hypothetical protein BP5796_08120 [Coleophoma crateriformis]